jgi:hypothetical protein
LYQVTTHGHVLVDWERALLTSYGNPLAMIGISLLLFPKLALGLSGFETGVAVMPLVKGSPNDIEQHPVGRIRNTQHLLLAAALIMSVFLIASSFVTILLIPAEEFRPATDTSPAGFGLPCTPLPGRWIWHALRHIDNPHLVVRRRVGHGGIAQHCAALLAALRDGAGMGSRFPPLGAHLHRNCVCCDYYLQS